MASAVATAERLAPPSGRTTRFARVLRQQPLLLVSGLLVVVLAVAAVAPDVISDQPTTGLNMQDAFKGPSSDHLFGTDEAGRDIFTRVVHGTRYSLGMALSIVLLAAAFGTLYGAIAGFAGGWIDELLMRVVDIFLAFPAFVLAMAIAAAVGRGMRSLVIALAIIWWPGYARMIRGMVLSLKENVWVDAARALGASTPRLILRHVLPFTVAELNVRITVEIGYALVAVTSLSFIGLGAQRPTPEWGLLIADGRRYVTGAWWYPIFPGLAIYAATTIFSLFGDALSEGFRSSRRQGG
jgi:peptide/nickel transport system permease protein